MLNQRMAAGRGGEDAAGRGGQDAAGRAGPRARVGTWCGEGERDRDSPAVTAQSERHAGASPMEVNQPSRGSSALVLLQKKVFHGQGSFLLGWILMRELVFFHLYLGRV